MLSLILAIFYACVTFVFFHATLVFCRLSGFALTTSQSIVQIPVLYRRLQVGRCFLQLGSFSCALQRSSRLHFPKLTRMSTFRSSLRRILRASSACLPCITPYSLDFPPRALHLTPCDVTGTSLTPRRFSCFCSRNASTTSSRRAAASLRDRRGTSRSNVQLTNPTRRPFRASQIWFLHKTPVTLVFKQGHKAKWIRYMEWLTTCPSARLSGPTNALSPSRLFFRARRWSLSALPASPLLPSPPQSSSSRSRASASQTAPTASGAPRHSRTSALCHVPRRCRSRRRRHVVARPSHRLSLPPLPILRSTMRLLTSDQGTILMGVTAAFAQGYVRVSPQSSPCRRPLYPPLPRL